MSYNGWKNYETWLVKLWLDNEEGTYNLQKDWLEQAKAEPKHEYWTPEETVKFTLADLIKEFIEEEAPDLGASMYSDLINAALSEVDWQEIADNIISGS